MGFLDKIKDTLGSKIAQTPQIKATMLGPRGVGKTSIMASIFSDTRQEIAGTKLYFSPQASCSETLISKKIQLMRVIEDRKTFADVPQTGAIAATNTVTEFDFKMGISGRDRSVEISIKDFPGEYLHSRPAEVSEFIAESHVVMVAIDTPYLMEEDGKYNEEKNEVGRVINFFKNHASSLADKLVLLVPLKCEKYFHNNTIEAVSAKVENVYKELIDVCKKNNVACVITPIQTIGGVEFDKFTDNSNPLDKLTKLSTYRFYGNDPKYQPIFCVQPLYYLLTYVANYYEWSKSQQKGFLDRMRNSLVSVLKNDTQFFHEIKKLSMKAKTRDAGYRIVNDNTILNIK